MQKLFLFLLVVLSFNACSKEETCTTASFVGTWKMPKGCLFDDTNTLTIGDAGGGKIEGVYTGGGVTGSFSEPWTVTNCSFTSRIVSTDFEADVTATGILEDGKLSITYKGKYFGISINCTENLTK